MNPADVRALMNADEAVRNDPVCRRLESEQRANANRLWSAMMLTSRIDVCEAILQGLRVLAARLDEPEALRRAMRGASPAGNEFITITDEQLDALNECGPLRSERRAAR